MKKFELVEPSLKYKKGFDLFHKNYKESGEHFVPFVLKFYENNLEEYIALLKGFSKGVRVPDTFTEHSTFWLKDEDDNIKGVVNIRHRITDSLRRDSGLIGYGIAPMYRKQGYATVMLKLALQNAKQMGINKALITCAKENIGSAKVILNNNGILDSEEMINSNMVQRYWVET